MIISDLNLLQAVDGAGVVGGGDDLTDYKFTGVAFIRINPTVNGQKFANNALALSEAYSLGKSATTVTITKTLTGNYYSASISGALSVANPR